MTSLKCGGVVAGVGAVTAGAVTAGAVMAGVVMAGVVMAGVVMAGVEAGAGGIPIAADGDSVFQPTLR